MPKASSKATKSKRGRAVAIVDEPAERGIVLRVLLHSPKDLVAGLIAFSAVSAIIANAIFLQKGHHPSPMFGSSTVVAFPAPAQVANPLPKPRPLDAAASDTKLDSRMLDSKPVNSANEPKPSLAAKPVEQRAADPVGNLLKAPAPPATTGAVARPPAAIPNATRTDPLGDLITNTRRVAAVQRALTEYGYGQLKPTGNVGSDTAAAIQRFERERKLPVTGQVSDRMVRELASVTGRAID
ncbi:Putative peptidoglycan binding domain-containing protein [Bradyrhizobium sp. NFR13]|uniref:peptidoglycan-binding domain-containing protein n=1 Tax=Bradyrhizobium sp. NFR13 TaxID=1566285 RepID=UPI0008EB625F|nr:peptidoglycan-binding domain-containing protein [Bradyrhizobium sp. NFR13]SFL99550.1 Putative peptidoglycan binding domain-containing protein [Bradyrhizobium sp. NFR13]